MKYRVDWWLERSKSLEYQKAYDEIASRISIGENEILVDVACGSGEIIRRLRGGRIIGTDITSSMLQIASKNLRLHNINSRIYASPLDLDQLKGIVRPDVVLLLLDNYLDSRLPSSFADQVVVTFPEVTTDSILNFLQEKHGVKRPTIVGRGRKYQKLENAHLSLPPEVEERMFKQDTLAMIERDKGIHRILVDLGIYTLVDYDMTKDGWDFFQATKQYTEAMELDKYFELISSVFIPDQLIASDISLGRRILKSEFKCGYSIAVYRKI